MNAGGVATSGLEMSQNALKLSWSGDEVIARLETIMQDIFNAAVQYGRKKTVISTSLKVLTLQAS